MHPVDRDAAYLWDMLEAAKRITLICINSWLSRVFADRTAGNVSDP
jgi:hypothetical protein